MSTLNTKGLDQLAKILKQNKATVRVGILGQSSARTVESKIPEGVSGKGRPEPDFDLPISASGTGSAKQPLNNAEIGTFHEFGTDKLPVRSFLRMPITTQLGKYLKKTKAFDKAALKKILAEGDMVVWLRKVGLIAETVIAEAFDTGGFGQWKPSNMSRKKVQQTLVETQQLRNSISSEVIE